MSHPYERFIFPEKLLADVIRKGAQGRYLERHENPTVFYRATVVAVDVEGGRLENPEASGEVVHDGKKFAARHGPRNPQNSVKARILTNGLDQFSGEDSLRVYWPFFGEHAAVPVKPGEHVYVFFEDEDCQHGIWINRVPGHEGANFFKGDSAFKQDQSRLTGLFGLQGQSEELTDERAGESKIKNSRLTSKFNV